MYLQYLAISEVNTSSCGQWADRLINSCPRLQPITSRHIGETPFSDRRNSAAACSPYVATHGESGSRYKIFLLKVAPPVVHRPFKLSPGRIIYDQDRANTWPIFFTFMMFVYSYEILICLKFSHFIFEYVDNIIYNYRLQQHRLYHS